MSTVDFIGYTALVINLTSMAMRNVVLLRGFSAVANFIYVIYGIILGAMPIAIGCSIAVSLHTYHLLKGQKSMRRIENQKTSCGGNENAQCHQTF